MASSHPEYVHHQKASDKLEDEAEEVGQSHHPADILGAEVFIENIEFEMGIELIVHQADGDLHKDEKKNRDEKGERRMRANASLDRGSTVRFSVKEPVWRGLLLKASL